ncbi:MAG: hypothetical protein IJ343_14170 [Clostridia bacterium]|nr:hypothetical protein [Clostridia bacterium]
MYKKQMTAQKVICLLSIIASVIAFIYALGLMTDLYDSLSPAMTLETMAQKQVHKGWPKGEPYPDTGFHLYYDMQPFNKTLLLVSIGLILCSCLLFITNTAVRRKYYIGNYIAVAVNVAANIATAVWAHLQLEAFKAAYLAIDFPVLEWALNRLEKPFSTSTFWFDAHYVVFGLAVVVSALLILNVIWKRNLMNEEKQLIEEGKGVSA